MYKKLTDNSNFGKNFNLYNGTMGYMNWIFGALCLLLTNGKKTTKPVAIALGVFSIYLIIAGLNYNFYLTNEFTPGGDGYRIYDYLKYMEQVPEKVPFWQAHKNHGYPLLADVENHMLWKLFLDTESPYFNIQLNFLFFFLTALFAFIIHSLAKLLGMSKLAAFATGLAVIFCVPMVRLFMHGTLSALMALILVYSSIAILLLSLSNNSKKNAFFLLLSSFLCGYSFCYSGYYFPLVFILPCFVFLISYFMRYDSTILFSFLNSSYILIMIALIGIFVSLPLLLPILDGVYLSQSLKTGSPTIIFQERDLYNYYLGLWPFILLALVFSKGLLRRYAFLFCAMASINFIIIFFEVVEFRALFDAWSNTPILRYIRWQHPFRELSSISAAFCFGIFIDSCRTGKRSDNWLHYFLVSILFFFMAGVAWLQYSKDQPMFMVWTTILFMMLFVVGRRLYVALPICLIVFVVLAINFKSSPFTEKLPVDSRLYKASNSKQFKNYEGEYTWWLGSGIDRFTPYFRSGSFSMVFMSEYRLLLSLLYGQDIKAMRLHRVRLTDGIDPNKRNLDIAKLMAIAHPNSKDKKSPFRIYDQWVIAEENEAIAMMRSKDFKLDDPIIIDHHPNKNMQKSILPFNGSAELIDKTAESLRLQVTTNKNSIVLIPEIYHRDWTATVNGKKITILKAFASMRAVPVAPGISDIVLRFVYKPFWIGFWITIIALPLIFYILYYYQDRMYRFLGLCSRGE